MKSQKKQVLASTDRECAKKKIRVIVDPRDKEWDLGAFVYNFVAISIMIVGSCFAVYFVIEIWIFLVRHHH